MEPQMEGMIWYLSLWGLTQMKDSQNMHLFHTLASLQVLYLSFDKFSQVKG